jgi:phosphoesterase RecJ-like protein
MSVEPLTTDYDVAVAEIRSAERFLLVTHEHPDGDALGSLVAMQGVLRGLGKDSAMFIDPADLPLPYEYRFFELDGLLADIPTDLEERTVIFLDCGNLDRNPAHALHDAEPLLNVDHHHDNTRFGTVNLVNPQASCTAEIVWELMHTLGVDLTAPVADALYVGLITDTGCFAYENTGPRAHEMAAELVAFGVDVATIHRRIYEDMPFAKLALLARALSRVERYDDGHLTLTHLTTEDFAETGAEDSHTEGIIDHLRAVSGTQVAAVIREQTDPDRGARQKVSLRATGDDIDVSAIARHWGGGGHRRAAGFSSDLTVAELVEELRRQVRGG